VSTANSDGLDQKESNRCRGSSARDRRVRKHCFTRNRTDNATESRTPAKQAHIYSPATTTEMRISCQVCWRAMRWHNGRTRHSPNRMWEEVFQDCHTKWEESAAHSILARSIVLQQRPNTFAQTNPVILTLRLARDQRNTEPLILALSDPANIELNRMPGRLRGNRGAQVTQP
jgi:hypothetical protein